MLKRALVLFERSGFLKIRPPVTLCETFSYRILPHGGLLKHNLIQECISSASDMYSGERLSLMYETTTIKTNKEFESVMAERDKQFYEDSLEVYGKLPFGYGLITTCRCPQSHERELVFNEVPKPDEYTELSIQYFVTHKSSSFLRDKLETDRLTWWKALTSCKDVTTKRDGDTSLITLQHTCGECPLEQITITEPHTELKQEPVLIKSKINCDLAVLALSFDAYQEHEVEVDKYEQRLLFHPRLAPYKLGIITSGSDIEELPYLSEYVKQMMKEKSIPIYENNANPTNQHSDNTSRLREMGVPLSIEITDRSLVDGVIILRDLSAMTSEQVHISTLLDRIQKYTNSM